MAKEITLSDLLAAHKDCCDIWLEPRFSANGSGEVYDGVVYFYDTSVAEAFKPVLRNKGKIDQGVDASGKLCWKGYLHRDVFNKYCQDNPGFTGELTEQGKKGIQFLSVPHDERYIRMAVAPCVEHREEGKAFALILRQKVRSGKKPSSQEAKTVLDDAGLSGLPFDERKRIDDDAYTVTLPIAGEIANAIVACTSNQCADWRKEKALGETTVGALEELACTDEHLNAMMGDERLPNLAESRWCDKLITEIESGRLMKIHPGGSSSEGVKRVTIAANDTGLIGKVSTSGEDRIVVRDPLQLKSTGHIKGPNEQQLSLYEMSIEEYRRLCKVVQSELPDMPVEEQLPQLNSRREELLEEIRNDRLARTQMVMMNGTKQPVLVVQNEKLIHELSTMNRKPVIQDPLSLGYLGNTTAFGNGTSYTLYSIREEELERLCKAAHVSHIPEKSDLPTKIPNNLFGERYAGDAGRQMPVTAAILHEADGRYILYAVSDSASRLSKLYDQFGLAKEAGRWVTQSDDTPSIMAIILPKVAYDTLVRAKADGVKDVSSVKMLDKVLTPEQLASIGSADALEAALKERYGSVSKAEKAQEASVNTGGGLPQMGEEEGRAHLKAILQSVLKQTVENSDDVPESNQPPGIPKCAAVLTKVHLQSKREPEGYTACRIYLYGTNDDLRALVGTLKKPTVDGTKKQGWLTKKEIRVETDKGKEGSLPGMYSIVVPETLWKELSEELPDGLPVMSPEMLGQPPASGKPGTFADAKKAKDAMIDYFASRGRHSGRYVLPEEELLDHLKGKMIRKVTLTEPDKQMVAALDTQIQEIGKALEHVNALIAGLEAYKETLDFNTPDASSRKDRANRKQARQTDGVPGIIRSGLDTLEYAMPVQKRVLSQLRNYGVRLQKQQTVYQQQGDHEELIILDPDDRTMELLRRANMAHQLQSIPGADAIRFMPGPGLLNDMNNRGMGAASSGRIPEGELSRTVKRWKRQQDQPTSRISEVGTETVPGITAKPKTDSLIERYARKIRPILYYEKPGLPDNFTDESADAVPVLVLPLENDDMAASAIKLCEHLTKEREGRGEWITGPPSYRLSGGDAPATDTQQEHDVSASEEADNALSHFEGLISDFKFHLKKIVEGKGTDSDYESVSRYVNRLKEWRENNGTSEHISVKAFAEDVSQIIAICDQQAEVFRILEGEPKTSQQYADAFQPLRGMPGTLETLEGEVRRKRRQLTLQASGSPLWSVHDDEEEEERTLLPPDYGERKPYPLDATGDTNYTFGGLVEYGRELREKHDPQNNPPAAVKIYLSPEAEQHLLSNLEHYGITRFNDSRKPLNPTRGESISSRMSHALQERSRSQAQAGRRDR